MYRTATIGVFVTVAVIIVADLTWRFLSRGFLRTPREGQWLRLIGLIRIAVNTVGLACLAAVAVTGFIPVVAKQPSLSGYLLMVHVSAAGAFAGAGVAVAVLWMSRNQLAKAGEGNRPIQAGSSAAGIFGASPLRKVSFWIALATSVPTLATALLAMFPLASPAQQQELLEIHRVSALLLTASGILFAYSALADMWKVRRG